ncbi:PilZ domain-containing protein [Thiorhodococcus fuscus]|uniref:PilZ domain-containing protein n=1 Tax=Thiorhodococcus fuscus TaxID=527200 RepID=A0ABW4YAM6_9GAMM
MMTNRRSQYRLGTTTKISVTLPDRTVPIEVENRNISWGGALFMSADPAICDHEKIRLTFPWTGDQSFSAEAKVMRYERLADGQFAVAVRFSCLSPLDQSRLVKLLKLLAAQEKVARSEPIDPIAETLDLTVTDDQEMRERLRQISEGRLSLTTFGAYRTDQSLRLNLSGSQRYPNLYLRARVVSQEILTFPFSNQQDLVKLELDFEHPEEDLREIATLLDT